MRRRRNVKGALNDSLFKRARHRYRRGNACPRSERRGLRIILFGKRVFQSALRRRNRTVRFHARQRGRHHAVRFRFAERKRAVCTAHVRIGRRPEKRDGGIHLHVGGRGCGSDYAGGREETFESQRLRQKDGGKNRAGTARQNFGGGSHESKRRFRRPGSRRREAFGRRRRGGFRAPEPRLYPQRKRSGGEARERERGERSGNDYPSRPAGLIFSVYVPIYCINLAFRLRAGFASCLKKNSANFIFFGKKGNPCLRQGFPLGGKLSVKQTDEGQPNKRKAKNSFESSSIGSLLSRIATDEGRNIFRTDIDYRKFPVRGSNRFSV